MNRTLNVLLVGPDYVNTFGWLTTNVADSVSVDIAPLALSTLAALVPADVHVDIWNEPTHGPLTTETSLPRDYDFVGITGYSGHIEAACRLGDLFRAKGVLTGVGGPGVSIHPHLYHGSFDVLFIGEAEKIWPQFLEDLKRGEHRAEYRQIEKPDLDESPAPRWDGLDMRHFAMGALQTTRGCPFDCEFCDVIYMFGRRMRHKSVERVREEFADLARYPLEAIFISDDEFVGDRRYARQVLEAIAPLNQALERPISLLTQATTNLSRDEDLLALAADAGFAFFFVGFETLSQETLRNIGKVQNLNKDLVEVAHKVLEYGMGLRGNTIVGFDEDDTGVFDRLYQFHQRASIPISAVTILYASHGTRLWRRLREEGRLVELEATERRKMSDPNKGYSFNIIPKRMSRIELLTGYRELYLKLYEWPAILERNRGWLERVRRPPEIIEEPFRESSVSQLIDGLKRRSNLDAEGEAAIRELGSLLGRRTPFMWRKMKLALTLQANMRNTLHTKTGPALARQIELEEAGEVRLTIDHRRTPVPLAFQREFRTIFPRVHRRVFLNLRDHQQLPEALTEVFIDFLTRWGEEADAVREHHWGYLMELCDRTCAQRNGDSPEEFVPILDSDRKVPDVRRSRLGDDILRNLDLELGFERAETPEALAASSQQSLHRAGKAGDAITT